MDFQGLKLSQDQRIMQPSWGVRRVRVTKGADRIMMGKPGVIGWGGNGGFHAVNLAVQFGVSRIILVGFDMTLDNGIHWHGPHPSHMNNPRPGGVERWRRVLDEAAPVLSSLGITVLNAAPKSALRAYPKMTFEEALKYAPETDHAS